MYIKIVSQLSLLITAIFALSCSNELNQQTENPYIEYFSLTKKVTPNQTLDITFSNFYLVEGEISITKQAGNYLISEIITNNLGLFVYNYKPKDGYHGDDYVEITRTASYMSQSYTTVFRISIMVTSV